MTKRERDREAAQWATWGDEVAPVLDRPDREAAAGTVARYMGENTDDDKLREAQGGTEWQDPRKQINPDTGDAWGDDSNRSLDKGEHKP